MPKSSFLNNPSANATFVPAGHRSGSISFFLSAGGSSSLRGTSHKANATSSRRRRP